jgi:hypothetical protein
MDKVRRLVAFLVVALLGATAFGLSSASPGIRVNGATVSGNTFRSELAAIGASPTLQCFFTALDPVSFAVGGGSQTMAAAGAAAWANFRIEGISISNYVNAQFKYHPDAKALAEAQSSLESEMTQDATSRQYNCPGTAADALAAMPSEMRQAEVLGQASSLYLVSKLNTTIPLTAQSLQTYYSSHVSDYDNLCVSIAAVSLDRISDFDKAQAGGESVANLAKQFSIDTTTSSKGGAAGCFAPSSSAYANVRADVGSTALNSFPTAPQDVNDNGTTVALFVAATKRTVTPFAQAESAVLADLQASNASGAATEEETILYESAVGLDPAYGQWTLLSSGPTVSVPNLPSKTDVKRPKSLTTSATTYQ